MISLNIKKPDQTGVEILIRGTVQGVGFRPFVYNLASRFGISGTVSNTGDGVVITAAARNDRLCAFLEALEKEAPPLARITSLEKHPLSGPVNQGSFDIIASISGSSGNTAIPPDIALCDDCLRELLDPHDRRFHYPFINCTNCGPRFTIIETIPYDRAKTSMKVFPMCADCEAEYLDPANRRFHAQPNACALCGPHISWYDRSGRPILCNDPIREAALALMQGKIIALRGLGGFHLAADASSMTAIAMLRIRKGRPAKPLAVMMSDIDMVKQCFAPSPAEEQQLLAPEHPIVLLASAHSAMLASNLAPGIDEIGIMLPYTPLHHLLFQLPGCPKALVMTSGNVSGSPICTSNEDALNCLAEIADFFLLHNREIVTRVDDSVCRVVSGRTRLLRRARGYVPSPVMVPWGLPPIIGCGAGLKSTFCLGRNHSAFLSQHIGDLFNLESYDFYTESITNLKRVFEIEPEAVACDLHPDYLSSHYATSLALPVNRIQHHHAHAVAVMAEHGLHGPVLAVVMDGTGYGPDGTIWGGEILQADLTSYSRLGHLSRLQLPGGDAASGEPWRMALSALFNTYGEEGLSDKRLPTPLLQIAAERRETILSMMVNSFNTPLTSSCGRLFDAVAAILGVRQILSYEGQAAMELEALARKAAGNRWKPPLSMPQRSAFLQPPEGSDGKWEISCPEFVRMVTDAIDRGQKPSEVALQFHLSLVHSIAELVLHLSDQTGITHVVLSGGCMQNSLILEGLLSMLKHFKLQVFTGENIPINDGSISLGQTIIGGLQHVSRNSNEGYQS